MDGDPNLPVPAPQLSSKTNFNSSSSSSSSFSSQPDFLRNVQAAFKRHRSIGTMQSTNLLPRRSVPPQRDTSASSGFYSGLKVETKRCVDVASQPKIFDGHRSESAVEAQEDASFTPPSISGTITNTYDDKYNPFGANIKDDQPAVNCKDVEMNVSSCVESKHCQIPEGSKKVKFSVASSAVSQGADGQKATRLDLATRLDNLSSHMDSLALTEMDWDAVNQAESSNVISNEPKHQNPVSTDADGALRADGGSSVLATRMSSLQNQLHHLRNFLHDDVNHPMTQSSVVGSSCATTTSVHATSAPLLNSTTHSCLHQDSSAVRSLADANMKSENIALGNGTQQAGSTSMLVSVADTDRALSGAQASSSATNASTQIKENLQQSNLLQQSQALTDPSQIQGQAVKEKERGANASNIPPPYPPSKDLSSDAKLEPSKSDKHDKAPSRRKGYDPDLFFKVNGKLYQRLGKIGSGGSSEVHKVISSDCTIYALKKIKLKGRDYATALGFCQEIVYLKKLKGKDNIIQLIDYEVTDKALLHEVMNGSTSSKDNRVKDDGYIYMVLEYGEIDLAHMLSQKWKEIERSNSTMDQNWLRFYWQQILQAVNTIHEERIVHSDLKPANFLLVKGSLKLIDFGIAKAIMSDTTNIQRDAQVGTLSYMSPEAFMCNESDANGNTIKCGRPSDIWSLGCILYQMVYGRTPFSEYRTFWAKFKVITDPNHEVIYGPVSNPWLLDLMKKCLAWDRNERWRIPELLEHPFLVPPVKPVLFPAQEQNCKFVDVLVESCANDEKVSSLCSELQQLLGDPAAAARDQQCRNLLQISSICRQLQEHITKTS